MTRQVLLLFLIGAGVVLPGCGGDSATVPASTSPAMPGASAPGPDEGASTAGLSGGGSPEVFQEVPGENAQGLLSRLVLYFEFDQSDIASEFNSMLAAHGEYLANNADAQVRLEGHADERGSREYNIGLGEERSQAVRRVLLLQGAATEQLSTVSFGEERPASIGSSEEAYGLNRRVELVYRQ
ncbi:MAG: peptidoglycan-associated lipoprotein Pal [Gammaproteobacteria bacterium]